MQTLNAHSVGIVFGAGGGLGLALIRQLLERSAVGCLWAASRDPQTQDLQALVKEYGDRLRPIRVDITDEDSIRSVAEQVATLTPQIHLLINAFGFLHDRNADIWPEKRLEDLTPQGLQQNFAINAMAPALIAKHFIGLLNHRERAVFATLSARVGSIADNRLGGWYAYRMSKAAQNMFTQGLAVECGRRAKRVICLALHPGTTDTGLSSPFQSRVPKDKLFTADFAASCLLKRIDQAGIQDSGRFLAWDGAPIPW